MRACLIALVLAAGVQASWADERPSPLLRDTAGVYFDQDPRVGESTMEIVPYGPRKAYIRLRTMWSNGHSCSAYGMFRVERDAYVYEDKRVRYGIDGKPDTYSPCRMTITRKGDRFAMSVVDLPKKESIQACLGSCGARGNFDREGRFRMSQRRPIRYMTRLLNSVEFEAAVAHDAGRIKESETFDSQHLPEVEAAVAFEQMKADETIKARWEAERREMLRKP
jgi:hypothetical protein